MSVDHSGHRQRLKRAYREDGLLSFSPHEVIELMLYPVLPRRDINELAHEISDRLGGVSGALNANKEEILRAGFSETVANALTAYGACVKSYRESSLSEGRFVRTRGEKAAIETEIASSGRARAVLLSPAREIIASVELPEEGKIKFLCERVLSYRASSVMILGEEKEIEPIKEALRAIDCGVET